MAGQGFSGVAGALHQVDRPIRQAGLFPELHHHLGKARGQLAGFENHRIARQQRRNDVAIRQMPGKIIGTEHRNHTMGAMAQYRITPSNLGFGMAGAIMVGLDGDGHLTNHRRHFGAGLPERLPGFQANLIRQLFFMGFQLITKPFNDSLALGKTLPTPLQEGITGLTHRGVDILEVGPTAVPDGSASYRLE